MYVCYTCSYHNSSDASTLGSDGWIHGIVKMIGDRGPWAFQNGLYKNQTVKSVQCWKSIVTWSQKTWTGASIIKNSIPLGKSFVLFGPLLNYLWRRAFCEAEMKHCGWGGSTYFFFFLNVLLFYYFFLWEYSCFILCVSFCSTAKWIAVHIHISPLFFNGISFPFRSPQSIEWFPVLTVGSH